MKVSYHLMLEEDDKKKLKHIAVDLGISLHELLIRAIKEKYDLHQSKERVNVRKNKNKKKKLFR